jgi:hypothetical protein
MYILRSLRINDDFDFPLSFGCRIITHLQLKIRDFVIHGGCFLFNLYRLIIIFFCCAQQTLFLLIFVNNFCWSSIVGHLIYLKFNGGLLSNMKIIKEFIGVLLSGFLIIFKKGVLMSLELYCRWSSTARS